jgi:hypothetical protein
VTVRWLILVACTASLRAQDASPTSADCRAVLPFHRPPIDADSILNRCNTGLAGPVVGILRGVLSQH